MKATMKYALPLATAILLAGCGGSNSSDEKTNDGTNNGTNNGTGTNVAVKEVQVNASTSWTYLNLETGKEVTKDQAWHLGFSRYNVITNSGNSGAGTVGSFAAQKVADFYDANGDVDASKLTDATLIAAAKNLLTSSSGWATPAAATNWQKDSLKSALNPTPTGDVSTGFNYGFYTYTGMNATHPAGMHKFVANPDNGVLLRSSDAKTYARVHLTSITSGQYTFAFDVAPAVTAPAVQAFTSAAEWVFTPAAGSSTCFDFDSNAEVACTESTWDMKQSLGTGARDSVQFYTNSGPVAGGKGGALGDTFNFTWAELASMTNASTDPDGVSILSPMFLVDSMSNAFTDSGTYGAFQYSNQKILSKYSVYLVTTDNSAAYSATSGNIYAVQLADYYGGATGNASGYPKIRYVKVSDLAK